jgi:hypothetical protein
MDGIRIEERSGNFERRVNRQATTRPRGFWTSPIHMPSVVGGPLDGCKVRHNCPCSFALFSE